MRERNGLRVLVVTGVIALAGCTTMDRGKPVAAGDRVGVEFTCRLANGDIAVSTSKQIADDPRQPKSKVFLARNGEGPLLLVAGKGMPTPKDKRFLSFEEEVAARLAEQVIGMKTGESSAMELRAQDLPGSHTAQMAVVRQRPKEWRIARAVYTARAGKEPLVGQDFAMDPLVPGKVTDVADDQVTVRFTAPVGTDVETPFGNGTIRESPEQYQIVLHPRVGSLVRTGSIVGRITKADERMFTIDYGNPFGGEPLLCDVTVGAVEPGAPNSQQVQESRQP